MVRQYLASKFEFDDTRVGTIGFGKAGSADEANKIDIVIYPPNAKDATGPKGKWPLARLANGARGARKLSSPIRRRREAALAGLAVIRGWRSWWERDRIGERRARIGESDRGTAAEM